MFESLNKKLISRYPLLWNIKLPVAISVIALLHLLFYLAGLSTSVRLIEFATWSVFNMEGVVIFSVLVSLLFLIIWMVYYFKNNPFKSYYILGRSYLFVEFLLIFFITSSSSVFFLSYKEGLYQHGRSITKNIDLKEEINIANLARHFIVYDRSDFKLRNSCDTVARFNALETRNDSLLDSESFLYYCKEEIQEQDLKLLDKFELSAIANRWLTEHKVDSVKWAIYYYVNLCSKYGVANELNADRIAESVFTGNNFAITYDLEREGNSLYQLDNAFEKVNRFNHGFWNIDTLLIILYFGLGASLLLFSFRITRVRPWFIALIGIIVWSIIIGLVSNSSREIEVTIVFVLILWLLFADIAFLQIKNQEQKRFSGVFLNWFIWSTSFVIPLVISLIFHLTYVPCPVGSDCPPEIPLHTWIGGHWTAIHLSNIVVMIVLIFVLFIPLARRWQANPEE
jgi:hypothetical protein